MAFFKNYCETVSEIQNGLLVSTKSNPSEHGYGMRSIQSVVNRYDGELKISTVDHVFKFDIILPIPMDFFSE